MTLKTDYKDDVFTGNRKYQQVTNSDGTVSLVDKTTYTVTGDTFGADNLNDITKTVNDLRNDNILTNGYFKNPVNSKGQSSYTSGVGVMPTIDKWTVNNNTTLTINTDTITVTNGYTDVSWFTQVLDGGVELGKYVVTINVKAITGDVFVYIGDTGYDAQVLKLGVNTYLFTHLDDSIDCTSVFIKLASGASVELEYFKFESGEHATPFFPKIKAQELSDCGVLNTTRYGTELPTTGAVGDVFLLINS